MARTNSNRLNLLSTVFRLTLASSCFVILAAAISLLPDRMQQASAAQGKVSEDSLWQEIHESSILNSENREVAPASYRTMRLDRDALTELLGQAPMEQTGAARSTQVVMSLPMPDGTFARFRIEESPIMGPELAARYPEIKTYLGQGLDDPIATARFDLTPAGLHATVLSLKGMIAISPYSKGDATNYITYYAQDLPRTPGDFRCLFDETRNKLPDGAPQPASDFVSGATLRTYRLALAATGEYTQTYGGGTVAGGLAAITTTVNNANAVLEKEVAIRLILISNEESIIFTDPATDGYTHGDILTLIEENQTKLDTVIGPENYDIGHVFDGETIPSGFGAFGAAFFGVCQDGVKAKGGAIFQSCPPGNPACIRTVLHEVGHQFTARHTYNGTTAGCTQRDSKSAYEPGSGSTIMSYSGICSAENLPATQLYHTASLEQIITYSTMSTGDSCAAQISTGNNPPAVASGASFTIPKQTPFTLTATASDVDGDMLTYSWEELDLAAAPSPPNTDADGQERPIFRVFDPVTRPSRTFPQLSDILSNTSTFGEALPTITRTMSFQVTVRDNRAGGGGVQSAAVQVNVRGDSGPFAVTQPAGATTWTGGSTETVMWSVNGTDLPPVSATDVKISLSTDGGFTFALILAASTPNDGSEVITVPDLITTTQARIKVEAVDNIFFDLSDTNFTVIPSGVCPAISNISQSIGSVGTSLKITGANFTGVTAVRFANDIAATFTVNSSTEITTTVPSGAVTGPIAISKAECSDVQTSVFTVSSSPPSDLAVDDGSIEFCLGAGTPGTTVHFVNRLTPSSYPATLVSASINFPNCGLQIGSNVAIVVGNSASGGSNINGTVFQVTPATVQAFDQLIAYSVPNVTIASGDFVVGFRITAASGLFPVAVDSTTNQNRSYISFDGASFDLVGNIFPCCGGNFGIRARVFSGAANCPTVTGINPTSGPVGTTVTITGTNLSRITRVMFAGNVTVSFNIESDTKITTTVPSGAITGPIRISGTGCSDAESATFTVDPP